MSYKSELKGTISNGATVLTMDSISNGYINSLAIKFDAAATGTLSLVIRKLNSAGVSTDTSFASNALTAKTDVVYRGSAVHFEPGNQLVIQSNCGAASYFCQMSDDFSALETWYEVVASELEESSSSSSTSSSSSSSLDSSHFSDFTLSLSFPSSNLSLALDVLTSRALLCLARSSASSI